MVLIEICSMMVLTTGKTTTTGMLAMLSNSTVTGGDVTTMLTGVGKSGRHIVSLGRVW